MKKFSLIPFFLFPLMIWGQNFILEGKVLDENHKGVANVNLSLRDQGQTTQSDGRGNFVFEGLDPGKDELGIYAEGWKSQKLAVEIGKKTKKLEIVLEKAILDLAEVEISASTGAAMRSMRNVEGLGIYAARKSEVIELDNITANLATNNPRQVYKGIAGLNIWENDGGGLQLSIGARGLDPNRTSNFNTRQNGYDISADALGYPESYYTPPTQALKRIEIVRGAASLQYGPQFGGLLNFVFKKGPEKKAFEFTTENTVGSFGLFNSFNSIGGSKKGWNYYAFYQRKQGNGWRPNSGFHQNTAYASVSKEISDKLTIGLDYTFMDYLAQQSGGLQDFEFAQDARQSKRERNWFKVNWNLAAFNLDYRFSINTKLNSRSFFLAAKRQALGELGPINRPDPLRERDLIRGTYLNFGNETRLIHTYQNGQQLNTFLIGVRYYQGFTTSQQGDASDGSDADFTFLNPDNLERSDYQFPSRNASVFVENLFQINQRWNITPGARFEYIRTASEGYFKERVFSGGQLIFEQKFDAQQQNGRSFALLGVGTGYKLAPEMEAYANFSQNYRSINFSDLAVVNPNLVVDSLLQDERGFNADLGLRGTLAGGAIRMDASLFYLQYRDRIGIREIIVPDPAVVERAVAFRTNIGDARIVGLEAYVEADIWRLFTNAEQELSISIFGNASLLRGQYISGASAIVGNSVELIPPFSLKTGVNLSWRNLRFAYQYAYVGQHFSDATNAVEVRDATRGIIPSYSVQDLSASYVWKRFKLEAGINNLLDARYFTRRAAAYPGPGIIPADGRSVYVTLGVRI
ncbi:MAG: TonB-dependent receptor [Bacteroidota bacterium]